MIPERYPNMCAVHALHAGYCKRWNDSTERKRMPVGFAIGRAGSGKSHRIFRRIVDALRADPLGPPIFWLLPRQATFNAERELTCASGLKGFCRARILSFEDFGREIFEDCGGSSIPQVTPIGRQMILGHLLRQAHSELRFFKSVARQPGLAAELDSAFEELERAGKGAADLTLLIQQLEDEGGDDRQADPFLAKIHDLRLLYQKYAEYLGRDRLDQHRRTNQVLASLSRCSLLPGAAVYVDGFVEFTDFERQLLAGVAKAGANVEVSLLIDPRSPTVGDPRTLPRELSLFHQTEDAYRRLYFAFESAGLEISQPVLLPEIHRFSSPSLAHLERHVFDTKLTPFSDLAGIELIQAPDRRAEADAVARSIRAELAGGRRLRDIAVLVRDLGSCHAEFAASFDEHNISFFLDRRRTAAHHPLLQTLRSIIQIARSEWNHDAVMTLFKSGLAGVDPLTADGIENYVLAHRLFGRSAWEATEPWAYHRKLTRKDEEDDLPIDANEIETIRRHLIAKLGPLLDQIRGDEPRVLRDIAAEVFATFDRLKVPEALARWMEAAEKTQRIEQAREHEQVWEEMVKLFQEMTDLLGDEQVTPGDFIDILESGLERFDLGLTPATVDQVLFGQIDRTRSPNAKVVFLSGMNEGEFPAVPRDGALLSDRERRELGRRNLELDPGLHRLQLNEYLLAYIGLTRASERLYLTRALADRAGKPLSPSPFWQSVRALFPIAQCAIVEPLGRADADSIATPRQLVTALMRWARSRDGKALDSQTADPSAPWPSLYQFLATHPCNDDDIDIARSRGWKALSYSNAAQLSPGIRLWPIGKNISASPSELETFAACPFRHFLKYGLQVRTRDDRDIGPQDLSEIYHQLLERLIGSAMTSRKSWDGPDAPVDGAAIHAAAEQIARNLRHELMLGSARNRYLLRRIEKNLEQFIAFQMELLRRGRMRPAFTALTYGHGGRLPELKLPTPGGASLHVHGRIDRVDVAPDSNACALFDYKLGASSLSTEYAYYGLSLQLLAGILALREANPGTGRSLDPIGGFYLQLLRTIERIDHPDDAPSDDDPKRNLASTPRGVFDARSLPILDSDFAGGRSQVVSVFVKKDGSLGLRNNTDAVEPAEFEALLSHARDQMGRAADGILAGQIDVAPYRINRISPCPRCEFRSVCRFETSNNRYRMLPSFGREQTLVRMTEGSSRGEGNRTAKPRSARSGREEE